MRTQRSWRLLERTQRAIFDSSLTRARVGKLGIFRWCLFCEECVLRDSSLSGNGLRAAVARRRHAGKRGE